MQQVLKKDYSFRLSTEFETTSNKASSRPATVNVTTRKLDWNAQQAELDKMFDKSLELQYKDLPDIPMSACLQNISLMDYQVLGIKWLVKRETKPVAAPFYKKVKENKSLMYLCEITQSSQAEAPKPIRGSILCDEMGLGEYCTDSVLILEVLDVCLKMNNLLFLLYVHVTYRKECTNYWIDLVFTSERCRVQGP